MAPAAHDIVVPRPVGAAHRLRLAMIGLGMSIVPLDTAVNISFPDITGSFGLPMGMIQWVVICYTLTYAALMLAFGRIGDIAGHARVFRAGLAWSVVAYLLCAASPSFGWLLFFRFLQGIGAGLAISCAPALVTGLYPEERRSYAVGMFTLIFALGSASGPLIGGALVAQWGWPAVFWFRAPIALTSLLFLRGLPPGVTGRGQRFDIAGAMLLALALTSLLFGINAISRLGGGSPVLLALAAALVALFALWERRAAQPIIRIELFRDLGFTAINLVFVVMNLATFSVLLFVPYFFARFSAIPLGLAGLVLATGSTAMALTSPLAGRLVARVAAERVAAIGLLVTGGGLALIGLWRPGIAAPAMALILSVQGIGVGLFQVAYTDIVIRSSPLADRGVAGSLAILTRTIGTVTGAALLTLLFDLSAGGRGDNTAFAEAFDTIFRLAGAAVALSAAAVPWWRRGGRGTAAPRREAGSG
ncbi:MAG: MFS transporter [Alphaproteobacteria bacterium]|nr:MFS transporter [Alphaproteobacteria bacterium]MBV9554902.1 MFS transporter [Alphaproteobacteria bacterium]